MRVIDTVGMGARFEAVPLKIPAVPQPGREAIRFRFAAGHLWHKLRFVLDSPLEGTGFELRVPRHESRGFPKHAEASRAALALVSVMWHSQAESN